MESRDSKVPTQRPDGGHDRHGQILMMNRKLMEDHLTFTSLMYDKLRVWRVLPETMVLDIENAEDENKVSLVINHLRIMGPRSFRKFCDLLDITGNEFLGQHLRAEESLVIESQAEFTKTLKDQYPQLKRIFSQHDLNVFAVHLHDQMNELVARKLWTLQVTESGRLAEQKKSLINDDIKLYTQLADKDGEIAKLAEVIKTKDAAIGHLENQMKTLRNQLSEAHTQRQKETKVLSQSNEACERAMAYSQERLATFDCQIKKMNTRIMEVFLGEKAAAKYDLENITVSRLEVNVERLFKHIEKLERECRRLTKRRNEERKRMFHMLQIEDSNQELSTAYDQGLSVIQGKVLELSQQTEVLLQTWLDKESPIPKKSTASYYLTAPKPVFRDQPSAGRASRISLMLKEAGQKCGQVTDGISDLRRQLLSKEHKISKLQHDIKALKLNLSPRATVNKNRSSTPTKLLKTVLKKESTTKSVSQVTGYSNASGVAENDTRATVSSPFPRDASPTAEHITFPSGTSNTRVLQAHKKDSHSSAVSFASDTKPSPDEDQRMATRKKSNGLSAFIIKDTNNSGSHGRMRKMSVVSRPQDLSSQGQKESVQTELMTSPRSSGVMQKLTSASDDIQRRLSQASVVSISMC